MIKNYPRKIICLTEESVETLHLIGKLDLVVGVSAFVKRPDEAQKIPKISFFTTSNYKKISELSPDLIIGYSDIQKDIARDLIELGHNVLVYNHRSVLEILSYIGMLSHLVDAKEAGENLVQQLLDKIQKAKELTKNLQRKPTVYFEEWDEPNIVAIKWVSEILDICGAEPIFAEKSNGFLAKERIVTHEEIILANPDIIFGCWCGKKVKIDEIKNRAGFDAIEAVKNNRIYELEPEIFLQPGPAPIISGIDILLEYILEFNGVNR